MLRASSDPEHPCIRGRSPCGVPRKDARSCVLRNEEEFATNGLWNANYTSVHPLADKFREVLHDQSRRGQLLVQEESEARGCFPNLVAASLGAL